MDKVNGGLVFDLPPDSPRVPMKKVRDDRGVARRERADRAVLAHPRESLARKRGLSKMRWPAGQHARSRKRRL